MHRFGEPLRILAATDLTFRSDRAVERAVQLARLWKAQLTLLHVVSDELPRVVQHSQINEAEQALKAQVGPWRETGLDVEFRVAKGHDYETIVAEAQKVDAKFIAMGTHRKTLMREHWFGTTVDQVVRHGDRSVLVVRGMPHQLYQRILVATDFSAPSRQALEFALLCFPEAQFLLVNAYHVPFKGFTSDVRYANHYGDEADAKMAMFAAGVLDDLRTKFGTDTCDLKTHTEEGMAPIVVHNQVKTAKSDLVVLGTHGGSGLRRALIGSIAEELISTLPVDVLAVRPPVETA